MDTVSIEVGKSAFEKLVADIVKGQMADTNRDPATVKDADLQTKYEYLRKVWGNGGWVDVADKEGLTSEEREQQVIRFKELVDFLEPTHATILFPKMITSVVREAAEPLLTLTQFFRRINYSGELIEFPAISSSMTPEDMGIAQTYPEGTISAAGITTAKLGKVGLAFKVSEEVMRYCAYDILTLYYRHGARAMARFKEQKASRLITDELAVAYDNVALTGSLGNGYTSGRDSNAALNGTLTLDDLYVVYAAMVNMGFLPRTILMNALGWLIFARSPELRAFGFANGGPMWQTHQGAPGQGVKYGPLGPTAAMPLSSGNPQLNPQASTYTAAPSIFPVPFQIVVSPFIRFDNTTQRTDVIVIDPDEFGIHVVDQELVSDTWDDPSRDVTMVKMKERYAFALDNEGLAGFQIKNLKTDRGYDWDDVRVWQAGTGTLPTSTSGL